MGRHVSRKEVADRNGEDIDRSTSKPLLRSLVSLLRSGTVTRSLGRIVSHLCFVLTVYHGESGAQRVRPFMRLNGDGQRLGRGVSDQDWKLSILSLRY